MVDQAWARLNEAKMEQLWVIVEWEEQAQTDYAEDWECEGDQATEADGL